MHRVCNFFNAQFVNNVSRVIVGGAGNCIRIWCEKISTRGYFEEMKCITRQINSGFMLYKLLYKLAIKMFYY
jgi:hypothetical protein